MSLSLSLWFQQVATFKPSEKARALSSLFFKKNTAYIFLLEITYVLRNHKSKCHIWDCVNVLDDLCL